MKDFCIQKEVGLGSFSSKEVDWLWQGHFPSEDRSQAGYLIPVDQVSS